MGRWRQESMLKEERQPSGMHFYLSGDTRKVKTHAWRQKLTVRLAFLLADRGKKDADTP